MAKKLVILGAGESGVGTAMLCKQQGYDVFVSDAGIIQSPYEKELRDFNIEFEQGGHDINKILSAEIGRAHV